MKETEIKKPLSVSITEFKQQLGEIINSSDLPIYILELVIKDVYTDVSQLSNQAKENEYVQFIQHIQAQEIRKIDKENNKETN